MFSSRENRCHRFQANIFNKSKCQNCFKTVDSHKLSEADLYQTKPVQVGWLLLAPEGTDFNNPGHKKRKWQRRYFVLYEHGLLRYSLDEMPGTLPQGSVNMTQCCEVEDAFTQTGFQNCLRLCFTDRDYFIRTENTNSISRWQENLIVYPKASKSNQRKRRKDTSHPQPAPAQQSEDNQTSSGSTSTNNFNSSSAKKNSSGNSVNSSSIIRRSSLNSGNNNAGRVSSAISDLSRDASTSNSSITKTSADTVSSGRTSSVSSKEGSGKGSVVSTVEGVSLLSSETGPQEESLCGGVEVSSSGGHAPSCNIAPDSSHSSSVSQAQDGSSTEGIRNRLGIESGYSSLEKTSPVVGDVPSHGDSRCASGSQPYMFSGSKSLGSSRIPLPTYRNSRRACGDDHEDVASCSWEMKDLESDGERKYGHQTHTSMTHKETQVGTQILNHDTHQAHSLGREVHRLFGNRRRRSQDVGQLENVFLSPNADFPPSTSSCTAQNNHKATDFSLTDDIPDLPRPSASCSLRSKSLERRQADPTPTPDLLNFKKGWMSRLGEDGKWHKHWFVLTDQTLRFYRDCVAEEAADVDGEINLSTCFDVTDYPVQRNYGFQIHTKDGVFTLCAMTYGIRRNWVQAVMKNVRPTVAPDVTWKHSPIKSSSVPQKVPLIGAHPRTSSSQYNTLPQEEEKRSRARERRREGRYKTFDWAELSCKQQKEEGSNGPSGREWDRNCRRSVPPAPASTPEEPITFSISNTLEKEYPPKSRLCQNPSLNIPSNLSLTGASSLTSPESISPDSLEVDAGGARIHCDSSSELQRAQAKKNKQVDRSTSPLPVTFCSSLAQTEWHWEVELQSLRRELRAEHERSQVQERESKLSQARLQAELKDSQDRLQKAELRIQEAETLLKERDDVLESLRGRLEEVTGRLKATEEAQALKEVRLQRHLRLLQESQERERRSFSDSLDQSEQRLKELEECLRQKEAELQRRSAGEVTDDLIQRCQELQNQLEESDSEVGRLQARLQTEETQYYDMEHDYERACEEIQSLQGALQDCERECAERFEAQLERQQQELDRKERELQEVLVKMAVLGSSLEETERKLKQAQNNLLEAKVNGDTLTESHHLFRVSNIRRKMKGIGQSGSEIPTQADESDRVISVIQALERKLCDTEERLRELTIHLQQQQQLSAGPHTLNGVNDSWCAHSSPRNVELSIDALQSCSGALHRFQEKTLDRTSDKAKVCNYDNGNIGCKWLVGEIPEMHLDVASSVLSLEALIIQRMASALQHPSTDLLNRLSEMHGQVLKMAQGRSYNGTMESTYSQIFMHPLEQDQIDKTLSETEIHRLCVRAEMAYLIHTFHTCSSPEQQDSEVIHVSPWPVLDSSSTGTKKENGLKQRPELADISPPELAPYSEQIEDGLTDDLLFEDSEEQHTCRQNLVEELRAQAQALQDLSTHLQSDVREADLLGELPPVVLRVAMCQATSGYMACRLRSTLQQEVTALRKQKEQAECECRAVCRSMDALFQEQTERYEEKLREERVVIEKAEQGRVSAETNAQLRVKEAERLQVEFEEKLHELQKIHEEEMSHLHEYYIQNLPTPKDVEVEGDGETEWVSVTALQERIRELKTEITCLREELKNQDDDALRRDFQIDLENIKATYEHGFSIMEESHQRVIEEMQKQHQREVERLTEERERVLQEETNATIAAIEAMRKAHKEEMDKSQKALQNGTSVDISQLRAQYNEELESLHRELEVLSEQYSQKCLENTHLTRTIEVERETLRSTHRENQELCTHNQELNECLAAELSLMHSRMNGEAKHSLSSQEKDVYQLEVNLRVKESEIKCLKQKISSLKLELHATNTSFKDFHSELSVLGVQTQNDFNKLRMEAARQQGSRYDLMKSKSNPDFLKDRSALSQPNRSKSLKDGLTVQERMKLFESSPTQTI